MQLKLFDDKTCDRLLCYTSDASIRQLYDGNKFTYDQIKYVPENLTLTLDGLPENFGTRPSDDLDNSIRLFSALKDINPALANDRRLWVTLTHTLFYNYTRERWGITSSSSDSVIKDRLYFEGSGLRTRNQNSVARLWWAARITYDKRRDDPFELTKLLWEKQDFYQNLIDRKFSTYPNVLLAFLEFYSSNREIDQKFEMRRLFKGVNAFGGVRVLPLLSPTEVKEYIYRLCDFYDIRFTR